MRIIAERRACTILRNLVSTAKRGRFLLPANVCPVVPLTLRTAGRPFEFIDIDPTDLCMDRAAIETRLSTDGDRIAGVIYVRTYGIRSNLSDAFTTWKRLSPHTMLIDDRCPCPPETDDCDLQGADVVLFSTGYGKYVNLGFGGFAWLSEDIEYVRLDSAFCPGDARRLTDLYKHHISTETQMPMDSATLDLGSWIPSSPLDTSLNSYLEAIRRARKGVAIHKEELNDIYRTTIPERLQLGVSYCDWRFQVRTGDKPRLLAKIFDAGVFASDHYYPASRLFDNQYCPETEALHMEIINLFNDWAITPDSARKIANLVADHAGA